MIKRILTNISVCRYWFLMQSLTWNLHICTFSSILVRIMYPAFFKLVDLFLVIFISYKHFCSVLSAGLFWISLKFFSNDNRRTLSRLIEFLTRNTAMLYILIHEHINMTWIVGKTQLRSSYSECKASTYTNIKKKLNIIWWPKRSSITSKNVNKKSQPLAILQYLVCQRRHNSAILSLLRNKHPIGYTAKNGRDTDSEMTFAHSIWSILKV